MQANGGAPGQQLQGKGSEGPRPAWVSDWRLKLALSDANLFQVTLLMSAGSNLPHKAWPLPRCLQH